MEQIFAPAQTYILLAVAATVGSIVAALVQSLFPRREATSAVVPEQSFEADKHVIRRRRLVVRGFGILLIVAWINVALIMLECVTEWGVYHWLHFIGLIMLLVVLVGVFVVLADRLSAVSTNFLEASPNGSGSKSGPSSGPV